MHQIFQKRRSVRSFLKKSVEEEKIKEILEAADSAPSAGNLKAREVMVVQDEKIKKELAKAGLYQFFIAEAPLILVFLALPEQSAAKYGQRGRDLYAIQDATIAAAFACLQAAESGLASCWIGGFDEERVKKLLKIPEDRRPVCLLPVGYEAKGLKARIVRLGYSAVLKRRSR